MGDVLNFPVKAPRRGYLGFRPRDPVPKDERSMHRVEKKVAPSEQYTTAIEHLLVTSTEQDGSVFLTELARLGAARLIQEPLEQEQAEHLGRGRYEGQAPGEEPRLLRGQGAVSGLVNECAIVGRHMCANFGRR
jgi:hypothetical protein